MIGAFDHSTSVSDIPVVAADANGVTDQSTWGFYNWRGNGWGYPNYYYNYRPTYYYGGNYYNWGYRYQYNNYWNNGCYYNYYYYW